MNELAILKWAAGKGDDLPDVGDVDQQRLLSLLVNHRLEARFLHRFMEERPAWRDELRRGYPGWFSPLGIRALIYQLLAYRANARKQQERQLEMLTQIQSALSGNESGFITFKGPTIMATTGDSRHLHFSGDLDILGDDPQKLWDALVDFGFQGETKQFHEYGALSHNGIDIEVHNFFPVFSYPPEVEAADLMPEHHPRPWIQALPNRVNTELGFDILSTHSMFGGTPETRALRIPDLAMSVIILCAHEFRNFVETPYTDSIVKLGTLADIHDLSRDARFDPDQCLAIMKQVHAKDCVAFVAAMLQECYGSHRLPTPALAFDMRRYPQALSWSGCWAALSTAEDILLFWDTATVVERLGANRVVATRNEHRSYIFPGQGQLMDTEEQLLENVILRTSTAPHLKLSITCDDTAIGIDLTILDSLPLGFEHELYIWCSDPQMQLAPIAGFRNSEASGLETWENLGDSLSGHIQHDKAAQKWHVSIPWSLLPDRFRKQKQLPLLFRLMRHNTADPSSWIDCADPVAIVPLQIIFEQPYGSRPY